MELNSAGGSVKPMPVLQVLILTRGPAGSPPAGMVLAEAADTAAPSSYRQEAEKAVARGETIPGVWSAHVERIFRSCT